jgi:hypothetical protein
MRRATRPSRGFLREHSLSLVLAAVVGTWFVLYLRADPRTHTGAFFGNALADWLGSFVFVIATKYLYEIGSKESRTPPTRWHLRFGAFLVKHSLSIALAVTGLGWLAAFARSDVDSKSGEVLGNVASEWSQILGLVIITKYAREKNAKAE